MAAQRVALLGPWPPPYGGVQTHIVALRHYLQTLDAQVAVVSITRHKEGTGAGIFHPRSAPALIWTLTRLKPHIIHLHVGGDFPLRVQVLALVCTLLARTKAVLTLHSGGYPNSEAATTASQYGLLALVLRRFSTVIAVNQALMTFLRRMGVPDDRVQLVEPFSLPDSSPNSEAMARQDLSAFARRHSPVLVSVGLLEPEYDYATQLRALKEVRLTHPQAGLIIIGSGSLAADLQREVATLALPVLIAGDVAHHHTLSAISTASALLRTTLYDGDSIAVREALALGTPVIATDNGMRPAGVHLIPIADAPALAAGVRDALTRPRQHDTLDATTAHTDNLRQIAKVYGLVP